MNERLTIEGVVAYIDPLLWKPSKEDALDLLRELDSESLEDFYQFVNTCQDLTTRVIIERGGLPHPPKGEEPK